MFALSLVSIVHRIIKFALYNVLDGDAQVKTVNSSSAESPYAWSPEYMKFKSLTSKSLTFMSSKCDNRCHELPTSRENLSQSYYTISQ